MSNPTKMLLATALIATTVTACDKQDPNATIKTASSTTTTTVTTTSSTATTPPTTAVASSPAVATASVASATTSTQNTVVPSFPNNKSIVTQPVTAGTPEATVKNAMDAMMNGTAKQVASYYQVDIPDFEKILAEQQPMVKQQLTHLELEPTIYNSDKTKAFIVGKMTTKSNPTPQTMKYKLIKVKNEWKLVE